MLVASVIRTVKEITFPVTLLKNYVNLSLNLDLHPVPAPSNDSHTYKGIGERGKNQVTDETFVKMATAAAYKEFDSDIEDLAMDSFKKMMILGKKTLIIMQIHMHQRT